jgi:flagellar basal-body rod protein FlgB
VSLFATDAVGAVLHGALNGISFRQNVIADNIANVDTPGFRATSVDFETSLRQAISAGDVDGYADGSVAFTATPTDTPVGANDNNVDLRKETIAAMQSTFQYQIVSRSVTDRMANLQTAAAAF